MMTVISNLLMPTWCSSPNYIKTKNTLEEKIMKTIDELINTEEPAIDLINEWISESSLNVEILQRI